MKTKRAYSVVAVALAALVLWCVSCEKDSTIGPGDNGTVYTRLTVNLSAMTEHIGQRAVFDVRGTNSALIGRAILDPIRNSADTFVMPGAIAPNTTDSLCFFADVNASGTYDPPPTDHAWRLVIPSGGTVNFAHNTSFADIGTVSGLYNLVMNFAADFGVHASGKLVEIRVADSLTGQTVGLYRKGTYLSGAQQILIPGVLKGNTAYRIDFYADQDGDQSYDAPPTDHAWRLYGRTATDQIIIDFVTNTAYVDIKF